MRDQPGPSPLDILLPPWWQVLLHGAGFPKSSPWAAHWAITHPAGPWTPNALTLMTHTNGGRIAVDLDMNDNNTQATWWLLGYQVRLLATSLNGLAELLEGGPMGIDHRLLEDPGTMNPADLYKESLPMDPLTTQWKSLWASREAGPMEVISVEKPGQGVLVGPGWFRHPGQLLFARPKL